MTKRMSIVRILLLGAAAALLGGSLGACSVKEDRELCPCYLNVSFTEGDRETVLDEVGLIGWREAGLFRDSILIRDYDPYWVKAVRKGMVRLGAWRGVDLASARDHFVTISTGRQCDSLYAYHEEVDCTGEEAYAEVEFQKQFCTVYVSIRKSEAEMRDFSFLVEGNTCGFDLLDFQPVPGTFRYEPSGEDVSDVVTFRIPRQSDDSMAFPVWHRNAGEEGSLAGGAWQRLGVFPLGKYIVRTGYDWKADVLQDVYVVIDLVLGHVVISVDGWEDGVVFHYVEQ